MGKIIKQAITFLFIVLSFPFYLFYLIERLIVGSENAFQGASQFFSLFPGTLGMYFRRGFCILSLKSCSWDCYIGFGTIFSHSTASIGNRVYIGANCTIGDVDIADLATIGSNVDIMNGGRQHDTDDVTKSVRDQGGEFPKVFIGEDSWIGNSSIIMANVGKKTIIGAGSVVIKDIGDLMVAVGNPAIVIRKRA